MFFLFIDTILSINGGSINEQPTVNLTNASYLYFSAHNLSHYYLSFQHYVKYN